MASYSKTVSIPWSDGTSNFGAILSNKDSDKYYSCPLYLINDLITTANFPGIDRGTITSLKVSADLAFECSAGGNFNYQIGFGNAGAISDGKASGNIASSAMKGSTNGVATLTTTIQNNKISTSYPYLVFRIYSTAWGKKSYSVTNVKLSINYTIPDYTVTLDYQGGEIGSNPTTIIREAGTELGSLPVTSKQYYIFGGWKTSSGDNVYLTTKVNSNMTLYAKWVGMEFYVSAESVPYLPETINEQCIIYGQDAYRFGDEVTLTANFIPENLKIKNWSWIDANGNEIQVGTGNSFTFIFNENFLTEFDGYDDGEAAFLVYMEGESCNCNFSVQESDGGYLIMPDNSLIALNQNLTYPYGQSLGVITAIPNQNYIFSHWENGDSNPQRIITILDLNNNFIAYFEKSKINNVLFDSLPMGKIYIDNQIVKKIFVETNVIYK